MRKLSVMFPHTLLENSTRERASDEQSDRRDDDRRKGGKHK